MGGRHGSDLRVATDEGEAYAQVVKIMGGSVVSLIDLDGNPLTGYIRGKFRGRGKRDNYIEAGTWLLVGLYPWQSNEVRKCDVLEVYRESDKTRLRMEVTSVDWSRFMSNDTTYVGKEITAGKDDGFEFADEDTQEYQALLANKSAGASSASAELAAEDEINVDDI